MGVLYHATYNAYLGSIIKNGLGGALHKNWSFSTGAVCLAASPEEAYAFAEVAPDEGLIPEEVELSGIVVLEVDITGLEADIDLDPNINLADYSDPETEGARGTSAICYSYSGIISPDRLRVYFQE